MTLKEAKALTKKWLKEKGFKPINIKGLGIAYICPMGEFSLFVFFYKAWVDDYFKFSVGCHFDDCEYGEATITVRDIPSNKNKCNNSEGFYYEELTEEQYLQCLNEIFDKYLQPYVERGLDYIKEILEKEIMLGGRYGIEKGAREKMNKLLGLNIQSKY